MDIKHRLRETQDGKRFFGSAGRPAVLSDLIPASRVRDIALVVGGAGLTGLAAQLTFPMWPFRSPVRPSRWCWSARPSG